MRYVSSGNGDNIGWYFWMKSAKVGRTQEKTLKHLFPKIIQFIVSILALIGLTLS